MHFITNVDLSPNMYFYHTFPFMLFSYFICMIIFLREIILSFQSHQTRLLSAGLGILYAAEIYIFLKSLFFVSQRGKCTQKLRNPNISGDGKGQINL